MRPPIPAVEATCPKCGQLVDSGRTTYCPNCGGALITSFPAVSILKLLGAICLGLLVLPLGAAGACFLIFSMQGRIEWQLLGIALGLLSVAALCLWGVIKLLKR